MTARNTHIFAGALGFLMAVGLLAFGLHTAFGNVTEDAPTPVSGFREYTFFASSTSQTNFATTTSATSTNITQWTDSNGRVDKGYFVVAGARDVTLYFQRGDTTGQGNTGSTVYKIQTSPDGTDWYDYPSLRKATTTNSSIDGFYTTVSSATIGAATSTDLYKMVDLGWFAIRCIVVETTNGEHSCRATAQW